MSFEEIISAIQNKPEIWMSEHVLYKNRIVKAKIWKELAEKLGLEEDVLKKRWKHLRDHYRKELKKQPVFKSGAEGDDWISSWQYFNLMTFVKDEVMPAPSTGNLSLNQTIDSQEVEDIGNVEENTETEKDSDNSGSEMIEQGMSPPSRPSSSLAPSPCFSQQSSSSSRKRLNVRDHMLEIEKKKLLLMEKRLQENQKQEKLNNDEDFLFLRSILPSMKKLTELQKFQFRGKVNEWLFEATKENQALSSHQQGHYQGLAAYDGNQNDGIQNYTYL